MNTCYHTVATLAEDYAAIWNLNGQYWDALLARLDCYDTDNILAQLGI
jgi:hypothetical protein